MYSYSTTEEAGNISYPTKHCVNVQCLHSCNDIFPIRSLWNGFAPPFSTLDKGPMKYIILKL